METRWEFPPKNSRVIKLVAEARATFLIDTCHPNIPDVPGFGFRGGC